MLQAFAKDRTTEQVFREVLGTELATYDKDFEGYVEGIVGGYRMVPNWDQGSMDLWDLLDP